MRKSERGWAAMGGGFATRVLAAGVLCAVVAACAGGGGASVGPAAPAPAASPVPAAVPPAEEPVIDLPGNRGFDGGTQVVGGFTSVQSSVQESVLTEGRNRVWGALPNVFRRLGVETTTVDEASYTIGNEGSRIARIEGGRLSTYLECGAGILGPNADSYDVTMQLMVQLAGGASGSTTVRTILDAYARPRSSAGAPLHCASERTLEARVLQLIHDELSGVAPAAVSVGRARVPVTGDHIRIECISPATRLVGEGRFMGASGEQLLLGVGPSGASVGVPATNVGSVQIRQRSSRATLVGLIGAVVGATAGGYKGNSLYDPNNRTFHYGQGVYLVGGAVVGAIGGMLVGRATGSFFKTDTWISAPEGWAIRYTGPAQPETGASAASCPSFSAGD